MLLIASLYVMSINRRMNMRVANLEVVIKPLKGKRNLISPKEIELKFHTLLGYAIEDANVRDLNLAEMEELLASDKRIKDVEVFIDGNERINVWIIQRQPIVRIMDDSKASYYLDEDGKRLELGAGSRIRVPIATGSIELYQPEYLNGEKRGALTEVYEIATYVHEDKMLSALIEQIDVESDRQITLIPKIGRQELTMGDSRDLDDKFENLKIMYKEGLPREGWRKYHQLKLDFKGQVVAVTNKK